MDRNAVLKRDGDVVTFDRKLTVMTVETFVSCHHEPALQDKCHNAATVGGELITHRACAKQRPRATPATLYFALLSVSSRSCRANLSCGFRTVASITGAASATSWPAWRAIFFQNGFEHSVTSLDESPPIMAIPEPWSATPYDFHPQLRAPRNVLRLTSEDGSTRRPPRPRIGLWSYEPLGPLRIAR